MAFPAAIAVAVLVLAGCSWTHSGAPSSGGTTAGAGGTRIAYIATLAKRDTNLFVVPASGGAAVRLTSGRAQVLDAAWNRQGTGVVYSRQYLRGAFGDESIGQIRVYVQRFGARPRMIRRCVLTCWAQGFAWSPDGRQIAFVTDVRTRDGGYGEIATMNADGSGFHVVCGEARCGQGLADPQWSPDGTRLTYSNAGVIARFGLMVGAPESHIWESTSRGAGLRMLTRGGCVPETAGPQTCLYDAAARWSPNGRWIAFSRLSEDSTLIRHSSRTRLELVRPNGTGLRVLAACGGLACNQAFTPAWSPDSGTIAYAPSLRAPALDLVTLRGVPRRVRTCLASGRCVVPAPPVWSPDGVSLAFANQVPRPSLFTIGADGAGMRTVTTPGGDDLAWLNR